MNRTLQIFFIISALWISDSSSQTLDTIGGDFNRFLNVGKDIALSPLSFQRDDFITLGGILLATGIGFALDEESRNFSQKNISAFNNKIFEIDRYYYYQGIGITIAGLYGYGLFAKNENIRTLGLRLAESTFYAGIIMLAMKSIIGRKRAFVDDGPWKFEPLSFDPFNSAFPSGHSTLAFSYAAVMADQIDNIFWSIGWYTAASLVAIARVYHDKHWFSDIIFGAALGHFIGKFVINHSSNQNNSDNLSFFIGLNRAGFNYKF